MSDSENTNSRLEYIEVTIGKVKMRTTKAMADRLIKQMKHQDERFYNPVEFVPSAPEQVIGTDNL